MNKQGKMNRSAFAVVVLLALAISLAVYAGSDTHTTSFDVGNANPTITNVESVAAVDLNPGTTTDVYVLFNASDNNGYADLNFSSAQVVLSKAGESDRTSSSCSAIANGTIESRINCTIAMQFYDDDGSWTINVSIADNAAALAYNDTTTVTVNALDDILLNDTAISCGSALASPSSDNGCDVFKITNRGNQNYASLNYTGYNFDDDLTGTYVINVGNMSVNVTDSALGQSLVDSAPITITDAVLPDGASSDEVIYPYIDIPSGMPADTFTATSDFTIEAIV